MVSRTSISFSSLANSYRSLFVNFRSVLLLSATAPEDEAGASTRLPEAEAAGIGIASGSLLLGLGEPMSSLPCGERSNKRHAEAETMEAAKAEGGRVRR